MRAERVYSAYLFQRVRVRNGGDYRVAGRRQWWLELEVDSSHLQITGKKQRDRKHWDQ